MRTLILIGGLAAGILYFIYEKWRSEDQHPERPYGRGKSPYEGDYILINGTNSNLKSPSKDDVCGICLDYLILRGDVQKAYVIISLPKCHHWFHQKCAIRLMEYHPLCPVCREPIDKEALRRIPTEPCNPRGGNEAHASSSKRAKKD